TEMMCCCFHNFFLLCCFNGSPRYCSIAEGKLQRIWRGLSERFSEKRSATVPVAPVGVPPTGLCGADTESDGDNFSALYWSAGRRPARARRTRSPFPLTGLQLSVKAHPSSPEIQCPNPGVRLDRSARRRCGARCHQCWQDTT